MTSFWVNKLSLIKRVVLLCVQLHFIVLNPIQNMTNTYQKTVSIVCILVYVCVCIFKDLSVSLSGSCVCIRAIQKTQANNNTLNIHVNIKHSQMRWKIIIIHIITTTVTTIITTITRLLVCIILHHNFICHTNICTYVLFTDRLILQNMYSLVSCKYRVSERLRRVSWPKDTERVTQPHPLAQTSEMYKTDIHEFHSPRV